MARVIYVTREDDPDISDFLTLAKAWYKALGQGLVTSRYVLEKAEADPELRDAVARIASYNGQLNAGMLGQWLGKHRGMVVDGWMFDERGEDKNWRRRWRLIRVQPPELEEPAEPSGPAEPSRPDLEKAAKGREHGPQRLNTVADGLPIRKRPLSKGGRPWQI